MKINKKLFIILLFFISTLVVLLSVRFIFGGPEDTWIKENGEWVKHGNPAEPKPDETKEQDKNENGETSTYFCPETHLNCMPGPIKTPEDKERMAKCADKNYTNWIRQNCANSTIVY